MVRHYGASLFLFAMALLQPLDAYAKDGYSVYLTSSAQNRYGGDIMLDVGSFEPGELPDLFDQFDSGNGQSLLPKSDEPVEVIVIVPRGASRERREELAGRVRSEVQARYPNMKLRIRESFVDLNSDRQAMREQREALLEAAEAVPDDSPQEAQIQKALQSVEEGLKDNENLRKSWFTRVRERSGLITAAVNETHPYNTIIAARAVAIGKFSVSGFVIVGKYGLNWSSAGIGAVAGGVAAAFGYNAKRWSAWCTKHTFPWLQDWSPVKFYNRTGWLKSANINLWRSLGISYVLRYLAYLSEQTVLNQKTGEREEVDSPNSLEFLFGGLGLTIPEIVLDGFMDDGFRALELKGRFNHQSRSYGLWLISVVDTFMHALFRANATEWAYKVAVVSWGLKVGVAVAGKYLPAVPRRFVFISEDIGTEKTAELHENRRNFFTWLASLGSTLAESIRNRAKGVFSVSDQEMVKWHFGLEETWNLNLSPEERERIHTDRSLSQTEFERILRLGDEDRTVRNDLWRIRNENLVSPGSLTSGKSLPQMCVEALTQKAS